MNSEKKHAGLIVVGLAILIFGGFVYYSGDNMKASAEAHKIAADMSNVRASAFAYYSETDSWPQAIADIQRQEASKTAIDTLSLIHI